MGAWEGKEVEELQGGRGGTRIRENRGSGLGLIYFGDL